MIAGPFVGATRPSQISSAISNRAGRIKLQCTEKKFSKGTKNESYDASNNLGGFGSQRSVMERVCRSLSLCFAPPDHLPD